MRAKFEELKQSIQSGNLTAVEAVLSDSPDVIAFVDENGDTALMLASKFHYLQNKPIDLRGAIGGAQTESATKSYLEIVKKLIKASKNINAKRLGKTMLMDATLYGYLATVKELICANIDINAQDAQRETALMIAARNGELEIIEELIKAKAGLNFINTNGETALMVAVQNGHVDIVKELIATKADLDLKDGNGETALMKAAKIGDLDIVKRLIKAGVNLSLKDANGDTALMIAVQNLNFDVVNELIKADTEIDLQTKTQLQDLFGFTDLHFAAWSGNLTAVKQLIEAGADLDLKDKEGKTALMRAAQGNYAGIVSVLLSNGADNPYVDVEEPDAIRRDFKKIDNLTLWTLVERTHYEFNPHRHVKIWLSKDPDVFMNDENQLRLVQMRETCPGDQINLIYDSQLLSEDACGKLIEFCSKHKIEAVNVRDIIPECMENAEETQLLSIYEDEITHLDAGGNLAAASDILRWLRPICRLGTYSDMDVKVSTKDLPPTIEVFEEMLLAAGSHKKQGDREQLTVNNDTIAVLNPQSEAIQTIQKHIINACQPKVVQEYIHDAYQEDGHTPPIETAPLLKLTPREFRSRISAIIREHIPEEALEDPEAIKEIETVERKLYMQSVISSTGPSAVMSLFNDSFDSTSENIDINVAPYSLASYPSLSKAFESTQACVLHASSRSEAYQNITGGDLSWTAKGRANMGTREQQLHANARKIQQAWKQALKQALKPDSEGNSEDTAPKLK